MHSKGLCTNANSTIGLFGKLILVIGKLPQNFEHS